MLVVPEGNQAAPEEDHTMQDQPVPVPQEWQQHQEEVTVVQVVMGDEADKKRPAGTEIQDRVKRLRRQFGRHLDEGVLAAVLEMHDFDYGAAEKFLQAENGDNSAYDLQNYNPATAEDTSVPKNYFDKPAGFLALQEQGGDGAAADAAAAAAAVVSTVTLKELFTTKSVYADHYAAQRDSLAPYLATLVVLVRSGYEVKDAAKARCLAALWANKKYTVAEHLLDSKAGFGFGLTEVLKAVNLLDSGRKIRALERRLELLQKLPKVKARTKGKVTAAVNDLKREPIIGSLSGALCKHIRGWVRTLSKEELQFFAVQLPREPWKELADLIHLNPNTDFAEDWFLGVAFGAPAPAGSVVAAAQALAPGNILQSARVFNLPYAFLRKQRDLLTPEVLAHVARYTPLETLLWWYEEFRSHEVDTIILEKLQGGAPLNMGYGKLMERLLAFKALGAPFLSAMIPAAQEKLAGFRLPLEPPVVCFGDASYSMDVAIRVSTIIASVMAAITSADLRFFNTESVAPPMMPRTIEDVLDLTMTVRADKLTAPAVALMEYYEQKIPVKTFVVVTDEVENLPHAESGDFFAQLFYRYRRDVEPTAQLVFVSFLPNQNIKGRMVRSLEQLGIAPLFEMRLDGTRPDLTKLDTMLVALSSRTEVFKARVDEVATQFQREDLAGALRDLQIEQQQEQ